MKRIIDNLFVSLSGNLNIPQNTIDYIVMIPCRNSEFYTHVSIKKRNLHIEKTQTSSNYMNDYMHLHSTTKVSLIYEAFKHQSLTQTPL